jgi:hypothetical protein
MIHKICPECSTNIDCAAVVKLHRSSCFRGTVRHVAVLPTSIWAATDPAAAEHLSSVGFSPSDLVNVCPACLEHAVFGTANLMSQWVCFECGGYVGRDHLTYFLGEPRCASPRLDGPPIRDIFSVFIFPNRGGELLHIGPMGSWMLSSYLPPDGSWAAPARPGVPAGITLAPEERRCYCNCCERLRFA